MLFLVSCHYSFSPKILGYMFLHVFSLPNILVYSSVLWFSIYWRPFSLLLLFVQVNNISGYLPGRIVFFLVCCPVKNTVLAYFYVFLILWGFVIFRIFSCLANLSQYISCKVGYTNKCIWKMMLMLHGLALVTQKESLTWWNEYFGS